MPYISTRLVLRLLLYYTLLYDTDVCEVCHKTLVAPSCHEQP